RMEIGIISAADIRVRIRQFADHLAQNIGQRVSVGNVGKQLRVLLPKLVPIDAIPGWLKKVVPLLPPNFIEDLFPLLWRINLCPHSGKRQRAVANFLRLVLRLGIDDAIAVCSTTFSGGGTAGRSRFIEQLGTVERECEALDLVD